MQRQILSPHVEVYVFSGGTFCLYGYSEAYPRNRKHTSRCTFPQQLCRVCCSCPSGTQHLSRNTPRTGERSHNTSSLDVSQLGDLVQYYLQASLAASTKRTYAAGQRRYLSFCSNTKVAPLPTLEITLCKFVAFLAHENLKHQTIKTYLSAVRNLQITAEHGDPFQQSLPLLEYVLRGIKSDQAKKSPSPRRTRLPITPEIMLKIRSA